MVKHPPFITYTVDGVTDPKGMTFDGEHLHIGDDDNNNFRMILPPTADGVAPVILFLYRRRSIKT